MQREPVHKDNSLRDNVFTTIGNLIDELGYDSLGVFDKSLFLDIEDLLLPSFVYMYYESKARTFSSFLTGLKVADIEELAVFSVVKGLLDVAQKLYDSAASKESLTIMGDIHPGGVTKLLSGSSIFYSNYPRYSELFDKLIEQFSPESPSLKKLIPKHTSANGQMFREFIREEMDLNDEDEIKEYYYNFGLASGLLLFFRAIDLNAENVLVNGVYPVFFDSECIFTPEFQDGSQYTIGGSGFLKSDDRYDKSSLTGGIKPVQSYLKPMLKGTDTKPTIKWKVPSKGRDMNIPRLKGKNVAPLKYLDRYIAGLSSISKVLGKNKEEIISIVEDTEIYARVIMHPTWFYKYALMKYSFPHVYTKSDPATFFTEMFEPKTVIPDIVSKKGFVEDEVSALSRGMIPVYYSNIKSKSIISPEGGTVAKLARSSFDVWKEFVLTRWDDFIPEQIDIVRSTYYS